MKRTWRFRIIGYGDGTLESHVPLTREQALRSICRLWGVRPGQVVL